MNELPFVENSLVAPTTVFFLITNKCNLRCKHCFVSDSLLNKSYDELNMDIIKKIVDDIKKSNVFKIIITGGEPFLHKNILDVLEYINVTSKIPIQINTNGLLITQEIIQEFKRRKILPLHFTISIEGYEEIHDSVRGKGNFIKVIKAIELLKNNNFEILLNITSKNTIIKNINKIIDLIKKLEIRRFNFAVLRPTGMTLKHTDEYYNFSLNEYYDFLKKIRNVQKEIGLKEYTENLDNALIYEYTGSYCKGGSDSMAIRPDGMVSPCTYMDELWNKLNVKLENILDSSLLNIWRTNDAMIKLRNYNNSCKNCEHVDICGTLCPVESYARGDLHGKSLYCIKDDPNQKLNEKIRKFL